MIGLIVLAIIIILYFLGMVGALSVAGALVLAVGSFMALIYDRPKDKWKRACFIALSVAGIALIVYDAVSS